MKIIQVNFWLEIDNILIFLYSRLLQDNLNPYNFRYYSYDHLKNTSILNLILMKYNSLKSTEKLDIR